MEAICKQDENTIESAEKIFNITETMHKGDRLRNDNR